MLAAARYGSLNAQIKTRAASLPSSYHYRTLLAAPTNAVLLDVLRQINVPLPEDGSLPSKQWLIAQWLVPDFHTIIRRTSGSAQRLVRSLISRFDLENVKYAVRAIAAKERVRGEALLDLGEVATVSLSALEGVKQTTDLHTAVTGTLFAAPFHRGAYNLEEEGGAFTIESMLDRVVYISLQKAAEAFHGSGAVRIRRLVTHLVGALSLLWLMRYRQAYGLAPEAAAGLSMINTSPRAAESIRHLAQTATFEEFCASMQTESAMKRWHNGEAPVEWERRLWRRMLQMARMMLYGPPFGFSVVVGFLFLKEWAIRDIALICQGRGVGLHAGVLEPALLSNELSPVWQGDVP